MELDKTDLNNILKNFMNKFFEDVKVSLNENELKANLIENPQ